MNLKEKNSHITSKPLIPYFDTSISSRDRHQKKLVLSSSESWCDDARLSWPRWWLHPKIVFLPKTVTYLRNNQAVSWPGLEPAMWKWQVQRPNHYTTEPSLNSSYCIVYCIRVYILYVYFHSSLLLYLIDCISSCIFLWLRDTINTHIPGLMCDTNLSGTWRLTDKLSIMTECQFCTNLSSGVTCCYCQFAKNISYLKSTSYHISCKLDRKGKERKSIYV